MYLLLTWYTLIMFLKVLSHLILKIEKKIHEIFKKKGLKYFKNFMKFFNISKWNISSCISSHISVLTPETHSTWCITAKLSIVFIKCSTWNWTDVCIAQISKHSPLYKNARQGVVFTKLIDAKFVQRGEMFFADLPANKMFMTSLWLKLPHVVGNTTI